MKTMPVEALIVLRDSLMQSKSHYISDFIATKACLTAFEEGQSNPKIKQLEWKADISRSTIAPSPIGEYKIYESYPGGYFLYLDDDRYEIAKFNSLDESKVYAQEDFERRIKGCLITE